MFVSSVHLPQKEDDSVVDNSNGFSKNPVRVVELGSVSSVVVHTYLGMDVGNTIIGGVCGFVLDKWSMENLLQPQSQFSVGSECGENINLIHTLNTSRIVTNFDVTQGQFYPKLVSGDRVLISASVNTGYPKSLPLMVGMFNGYQNILYGLLCIVLFGLVSGFYRQSIKPFWVLDEQYFVKLTALRC